MEFLTDFGKANWEAQERQRKIALEEARMGVQNAKRHQEDVNARIMDRARIQALGKPTPFGNEAFTSGNRAYDYDQNRQIIQAYISTRGVPEQKLPAPFTTGGRYGYGGIMSGGRIDVDSLVPVQDQPSFSLMENVLQRNQENYESNELMAEYNDDQVSETELEKINESRVKVMDILRGITAKLSAGLKGGEAFVLSFTQDLTTVYQELLNYGYGYPRQDLERIRVYLEEEPALIELDIGEAGEPVNKLALDILSRIVRPMLSPSFVGTMKEKKALMEPIIESFYKTIDPSESGNHIPTELRIESYEDVNRMFESLAQIYAQMVDIRRRQGTQQNQRIQNELLALKKQFDSRAERLFGILVAYSTGDIYKYSKDEIQRETNDFNLLSPERKLDVLQEAVDSFTWDEAEEGTEYQADVSYPPSQYSESVIQPPSEFPSEFGQVESVEEPLRMPGGEPEESKEPELGEEGVEPGAFGFPEESALPPAPAPRRRGRKPGSKNKPKAQTEPPREGRVPRLAPTQPPRRRQIARAEEEEALAEGEEPTAKAVGEGRRRKEPSRSKIHKSAVLKPETFKKFIESVMKHFDDSNIRRI